LTDGFVVQDRAADELIQIRCRQQQIAVGAAVIQRILDADFFEAIAAGSVAFVHGQDAFSFCHHGLGGGLKLMQNHR